MEFEPFTKEEFTYFSETRILTPVVTLINAEHRLEKAELSKIKAERELQKACDKVKSCTSITPNHAAIYEELDADRIRADRTCAETWLTALSDLETAHNELASASVALDDVHNAMTRVKVFIDDCYGSLSERPKVSRVWVEEKAKRVRDDKEDGSLAGWKSMLEDMVAEGYMERSEADGVMGG